MDSTNSRAIHQRCSRSVYRRPYESPPTPAPAHQRTDNLAERIGRQKAIVVGALLACAGVLVLTLVTPWQASLVGYVLVGLGCATIAPALYSLAGSQNRMPRAIAITAVSTLGFAGILAGPALIGFAANHFGLIAAFVGVAIALLLVAVSTRWLRM